MKKDFSTIAQSFVSSYHEIGGMNHLTGSNLPSKPAIGEICQSLLSIMFPGFYDDAAIAAESLETLIEERLTILAERIEEEICKSLRTDDPDCPRRRAGELTHCFLGKLPKLREILRTDIEAAYEGDPAAVNNEEIILAYPSIETVAIQRMAHMLYDAEVPLVPRIMTEWAHTRTGIDIHPGATIGSHFFIDHGTGVVIGETCVIGEHVKLYHGVTLGARSFQRDESGNIVKGGKRHPNVENNVTIYPNSTILGGETTIGEGTTVGANVFLMQSVPSRSLVFLEEKQVQIVPKR